MSTKIPLRLAVLAAVLLLAGCGRGISEDPESGPLSVEQEEESSGTQPVQGEAPAEDDEKETSSFWFRMTTFYGDT